MRRWFPAILLIVLTLHAWPVRASIPRHDRSISAVDTPPLQALIEHDTQRATPNPHQCTEDPFGNLLSATGPAANVCPFGFQTKYTDIETGLVYFGYRYYNPNTGTWLSRDPLEEQGGINLYAYCTGNPLGVDPLGLATVSELQGFIAELRASDPNADVSGLEARIASLQRAYAYYSSLDDRLLVSAIIGMGAEPLPKLGINDFDDQAPDPSMAKYDPASYNRKLLGNRLYNIGSVGRAVHTGGEVTATVGGVMVGAGYWRVAAPVAGAWLARNADRLSNWGSQVAFEISESPLVQWFESRSSQSPDAVRKVLELLTRDQGRTIRVVTAQSKFPEMNRALSVAMEDATALAEKASEWSGGRQLYAAEIPKALLDKLVNLNMAEYRITQMGNAQGMEIRFAPAAMEYIQQFFRLVSAGGVK